MESTSNGGIVSHFICTAVNSRGDTVSATGSPRGQDCHLRGLNAGIEVVAHRREDGQDEFRVWVTRGSHGSGPRRFLACITERKNGDEPFVEIGSDA